VQGLSDDLPAADGAVQLLGGGGVSEGPGQDVARADQVAGVPTAEGRVGAGDEGAQVGGESVRAVVEDKGGE
jgi:hypothetical protein